MTVRVADQRKTLSKQAWKTPLFRICKSVLFLNNKKTNNPIKTEQKI